MKTISVRVDDALYSTLVAEADGRPLGAYLLRLARGSSRTGPVSPPQPTYGTSMPEVQAETSYVHPLPASDTREPVQKQGKRRQAAKVEQVEEPDAFEGEEPADLFADENEEAQDG